MLLCSDSVGLGCPESKLNWTTIKIIVFAGNFVSFVGMLPSKHKTFLTHLYNVGPTSATLVQHCINVIQMCCVYWVVSAHSGPWPSCIFYRANYYKHGEEKLLK